MKSPKHADLVTILLDVLMYAPFVIVLAMVAAASVLLSIAFAGFLFGAYRQGRRDQRIKDLHELSRKARNTKEVKGGR